jgi:DNA-binding FadR family transcriptional regulator
MKANLTTQEEIAISRSEKVSDRIAREILADIVNTPIPVGAVLLSESQMLERYKIGRASLREALRILEVNEFIRMKPGPGGGPMVSAVTDATFGRTSALFFQATHATLADLIEARATIEPLMARIAAQRLTTDGAEALRAAVEDGKQAKELPGPKWSHASACFHTTIGRVSGNRILELHAGSLVQIQTARHGPVFPIGDRTGVLRVHGRIADAILARDGAESERLMHRHMQELSKKLRESVPGLLDEVITWQ